jgi:hypothetical protein
MDWIKNILRKQASSANALENIGNTKNDVQQESDHEQEYTLAFNVNVHKRIEDFPNDKVGKQVQKKFETFLEVLGKQKKNSAENPYIDIQYNELNKVCS